MALSSALSSALKGRLMKTSTAGQNQVISQQVNAVGGNTQQRRETRNNLSLPYTNNPDGTPVNNNTSANPTTGVVTPPVQSQDLTNYLSNLGVSSSDQTQYADIASQAQKNAQDQAGFSYADYYKSLSDTTGRTDAQKNLINLQNQGANIQGGIDLQEDEYSMGDSAMLDQARQNEFRSRPMRQQLALNIARQNVAQNAINLANNDITTQMNFKQKEFENKASSIKTQLEALKGKVPDYMIKFAEANLATQLQKAQSTYAEQLKTGDVDSTDPVIQKVGIQNAVNAIYEKYGTMISRSPQQIASEIQALMKAGVPFQKAMQDNLLTPLQSKGGYNDFTTAMQNKVVGIDNTPKVIGTDDWGQPVYGVSDGRGGFNPINVNRNTTESVSNPNISTNVVDFIKGKEGFRQQAYLDSAGVPTIGYGFTKINGVPVKMGDTMDRETADKEFTKQIAKYQNWSNYIDPSKLSEAQKTALTSFEYNLGSGIWEKNAMPILKAIESGDIAGAQKYMKQYVNAGGKFVQGLANRRNSEAELLAQKQSSSGLMEGITNLFDKFTGKSGQNTNVSSKFTDTQKYVMDKMDINSPSKTALKQNNISPQDFYDYKSSKVANVDNTNDPLVQGIGREFVENGKIPTEYILKSTGLTPKELISQGVKSYINGKNEGLKNIGIQITDISPYMTSSEEQKKNMSKAITAIPDLISKIDRWKGLVDKYGTEMESTDQGSEMKQLRTDILTTLKSEAFLNLGVLQPVDLQFMEGLVPNSNGVLLPEWNQSENLQRLKENFINKITTNGKVMGITPIQKNEPTGNTVSYNGETITLNGGY